MLKVLGLLFLSHFSLTYASFFHGPSAPAAVPTFYSPPQHALSYAVAAPPALHAPQGYLKYAVAAAPPHISYAAPAAPVIKYTLGAPVTTTTTSYVGFAAPPAAVPVHQFAAPPAAVPLPQFAAPPPSPFLTRFSAASAYAYQAHQPYLPYQPAYGRVTLHAAAPPTQHATYAAPAPVAPLPLPCDDNAW